MNHSSHEDSDGTSGTLLGRIFVGWGEQTEEERRGVLAFSVFAGLGIPILLAYTVSALRSGAMVWVAQDLVGAVLLAGLLVAAARVRRRDAVYGAAVLLMTAFLFAQVLTDPDDVFGVFWLFTLPFGLAFVLRFRHALPLTVLTLALLVGLMVWVVAPAASLDVEHQITVILVFALLSVFALTGVLLNQRYRDLLSERNADLVEANEANSRLARIDPLTSCYNRAQLVEGLLDEVLRAQRYGHPLAVVLADIDHFKRVNDSRGHLAGDAVLKAVAGQLLYQSRSGVDWVVRYGGEEFLLVLPETDGEGAAVFAERLREGVAGLQVQWEGQDLSVTMSFGVTALRPGTDADEVGLLARVDALLYEAKDSGRDRVVLG